MQIEDIILCPNCPRDGLTLARQIRRDERPDLYGRSTIQTIQTGALGAGEVVLQATRQKCHIKFTIDMDHENIRERLEQHTEKWRLTS
jgi:hypothetical protein